MIIIVRSRSSQDDFRQLIATIEAEGLATTVVVGTEKTIVGVVGDTRRLDVDRLLVNPIVADVKHVSEPFDFLPVLKGGDSLDHAVAWFESGN